MKVVAVVAAVLVAAPAGDAAVVRAIDTSGYPTVGLTVVTHRPVARAPRVFEGRQQVGGVHAQNLGAAKSIVLAVDRSRSMQGRPLADAVAAAHVFLAATPAADRAAVVGFGAEALQLTGFTTDRTEAGAAVSRLRVARAEGTALYDAVALGVRALRTENEGARLVVVLSDGRDVSSAVRLRQLIPEAKDARVLVYTIGIEGRGFAAARLQRLAASTGGRYFRATSSRELASVFGAVAAELQRTWRLEYATAARPGQRVRVRVAVPGESSAARSVTVPGTAARPGSGTAVVGSAWADLLLALIVAALVIQAARSVASYRSARRLRRRLQVEQRTRSLERQVSLRDRLRARAAGVFDATERTFGRRPQWASLEAMLNQADVPLRVVELVYVMLAAGVGLAFLGLLFGVSMLVAFILFLVGGAAPLLVMRLKARARMRDFDEQLPDLLLTLASSLKAGHSFRQGLQTIVEESRDPARKEFQRVLSEARLGRTLDDALADMAARLGSENFTFVVSAITIQRRVGGSLAGIFDMVADSVRKRQLFGRRLKALTAQGRISAYVLMALPIFLGLALTAINPGYMAPLFGTGAGHFMLMAGVVLMAIGGVILKKIASFAG